MKTKILLMLIMAAALLFSCQKEKNEPIAGDQEVTFSATIVEPNLKNSEDWLCNTNGVIPTHAWVQIKQGATTQDFYPALFTLNGKLYTQAIKLLTGNYSLEQFVLYKEVNGTEGIGAGDIVVYGTPVTPSDYDDYVTDPLPTPLPVGEFIKTEIDIEVLCFIPAVPEAYGFFWFNITEIVIREQCFFGDFCLKHPADYDSSNYALQAGWPKIDVPAIIEIYVAKKTDLGWVEVEKSPFTNNTKEMGYGVGHVVCIEYADHLNAVDSFYVELKILVKVGSGFNFVKFYSWKFKDDQMLVQPPPASDGVFDFVLGNCNVTEPDLQLAPYLNLPAQVTYKATAYASPDAYVWASLTGFGAGYDITPSLPDHPSWCVDFNGEIMLGQSYTMNVYSSLNLPLVPAYIAGAFQWDKINWIFNHLDMFPGYAWDDIQGAVWMLATPVTWDGDDYPGYGFPHSWAQLTIGQQMLNDANAYGDNYVPLPGGFAAVIFASPDGQTIQTMCVVVDP